MGVSSSKVVRRYSSEDDMVFWSGRWISLVDFRRRLIDGMV